MGKILNVRAAEDYKLLIDFDDGSNLIFNMQKMVRTIPYVRLQDPACFQIVKFDDKSVYWDAPGEKPEYLPLKLSVDSILFSLRG